MRLSNIVFFAVIHFRGILFRFLGVVWILCSPYCAQGQKLVQLESYFSSSDHIAKSNVLSTSGAVYITGEFQGELILGMNSINSSSRKAVYFGKLNSNGGGDFLKSIICSGALFVSSIALHGDSVIAVGTFSDSLFVANDTLVNEGYKGGYLVIFDTLGNIRTSWHLNAFSAEIYDVNITSKGDILICGEFYNKMEINNQNYFAPLGFNAFLAKLNPADFTPYWVRISEGSATNARSVDADIFGNIYLTGSYGNGTFFQGLKLPDVNGDHNMFIISYSEFGELNWMNTIMSPAEVHGLSQCVLDDGTLFVGGEFKFEMNIGQSVFYQSEGLMDAFIAKFNSSGKLEWSRSIGGIDNDKTSAICTDNYGNPILIVNGGPLVFSSKVISEAGFRSPALLKLTKEDGQLLWQYRIPAAPVSGIVEAYSLDCKDSMITLCGSNRTGLNYLGNLLDSPNIDDSFRALLVDSLWKNNSAYLEENDLDSFVAIYPNPSFGNFTVSTDNDVPILSIEFYDAQASLVKKSSLHTMKVELKDILVCGAYLVKIITHNSIIYKRLIIL